MFLRERFQYLVGHIRVVELIDGLDQHAGHIEGDVADADHHGVAGRTDQLVDLGRHEIVTDAGLVGIGMYVGMAAVPLHELGCRDAP